MVDLSGDGHRLKFSVDQRVGLYSKSVYNFLLMRPREISGRIQWVRGVMHLADLQNLLSVWWMTAGGLSAAWKLAAGDYLEGLVKGSTMVNLRFLKR